MSDFYPFEIAGLCEKEAGHNMAYAAEAKYNQGWKYLSSLYIDAGLDWGIQACLVREMSREARELGILESLVVRV